MREGVQRYAYASSNVVANAIYGTSESRKDEYGIQLRRDS